MATDSKSPSKKLLIVTAVGWLIALVALGYIIGHNENSDSPSHSFEARIPPADFLYLDGPRIVSYLAQLEGGRTEEVHRIDKEIHSINAAAGANGIQIGASAQHESTAESTITRTVASGLEQLIEELREDEVPLVSFHEEKEELRAPEALEQLREGWLVRFKTDDLLSPGYIAPYVVLRQSATLAALFPHSSDRYDRHRSERQKERAESFVQQVGSNPRITFAVAPPAPLPRASSSSPPPPEGEGVIFGTAPEEKQPVKLLLPMRYRYLTDERSLLEKSRDQYTGGDLWVIGKVIRVFKENEHPHCPPSEARKGSCPKPGPQYTDYATREIWKAPLEQASGYLIKKVSHHCTIKRTKDELQEKSGRGERAKGRACFLAKLRRQTELEGPGAVILPLAIYK